MKILVLSLLIFLVILFIAFCLLLKEYFKLKNFKKKYERGVNKIIKILERVRYGMLSVSIKGLFDKRVQNAINKLIETIGDRENMIVEYQKTLSEKNESLEKMIQNEKESQKFKEDFIATLTHDMKTPVIAELNTIEYLLSGRFGELNEKQNEALTLMKNSNEELIELAEILLETYKLQDNSLILNKKPVKINELLSDVIENMRPIATNSNIDFVCNDNSNDSVLNLDAFQIKRVFKNLVMNAISFSTFGALIEIRIDKDKDRVSVLVSNEGQGISEEDLTLIFNKYYSSVKKFRKLGTGLGLYLSNQIVKAHNGTISVESIEGQKTTFKVQFPAE